MANSMSSVIRDLRADDEEVVISVSHSVWEDDYVPSNFENWIENPLWHPVGKFVDDNLVAIGALELVEYSKVGWVKALRVHQDHQRRHHGAGLVQHLIDMAREKGLKTLWYATSTRNIASIKLAESLGFDLSNKVGYLRLYRPFPPHPKPSLNFVPLQVDPERLLVLLEKNPELIEMDTIPLAWMFYEKDSEGLRHLATKTKFNTLIDEDGIIRGLYYNTTRERQGIKSLVYSVFSNDQSFFVDIMSRILDESENSDADRSVFFLGKKPAEWIHGLIDVPEEFLDRRFLLYKMNL